MTRFIKLFALMIITLVVVLSGLYTPKVHAAFNQNLVIDDTVFNNSGSMNAASIDNWLNVYFPQSCISPNSGFRARVPSGYTPSGGFTYGGFTTSGMVIATAATVYGINPQVLLVTLQKEQSLVAGGSTYCNNGDEHKYAAAVGYGCPDSGTVHSYTGVSLYMRNGIEHTSTGSTCVNSAAAAGFSQQVIRAAWLLKFGQQRSLGNSNWAVIGGSWNNSDDPPTCYGGPMTQGTLTRGCGQAATYYDGYSTIDGTAVHMDSGATAALYWYTPHFHGNQVFYTNFTAWFGDTISSGYFSCHGATNISGIGAGEQLVRNKFSATNADKLSLIIPNNSGSACVEMHTWLNNNYDVWTQHTASNMPAVDPRFSNIVSAKTTGNGTSNVYLVNYTYTGSGQLEIHGWNSSGQGWISHTATNLPATSPGDAQVVTADTNGDGLDEFYLVKYRNTASGMVEIHGWSSNLQQWTSHVATSVPSFDPTQGKIMTADLDGNGRDEFLYIKTASSASGKVEFHAWAPNLQGWVLHAASNLPTSEYVVGNHDIIAADRANNGTDQILFVKYSATGSGQVEVHGWTSNFQGWISHNATSQPQF